MRTCATAAILIFLAITFSAQSAERAALVIGIDQYQNLPANAQLRVAVQDATLLSRTLSGLPEPFEVTLLTNATREAVSRGIDQFIETAKNAKCALVYFAGHGIEFHGENYLLVSDTNISAKPDEGVRRVKDRLYYESLSLHKLMEDLNETGANLQLVILDACRDNPLEIESSNGTRSIMGSQGGLGRVNAPSGMLISYSADAGQQANDGLFTSILSDQLKVPGSTLMEVFARTRAEVRKQATVLQAEGKGVLHEPAEYSKLEPSALRFSFVMGDPGPTPVGSSAGPSMPGKGVSEFQSKKVIETKIKLAELDSQMDVDRKRYQDATNVINTLTYNKRRPVVEGSPQYHQCVAASKIIVEIEQKAPTLKAERSKLVSILEALGVKLENQNGDAPVQASGAQ